TSKWRARPLLIFLTLAVSATAVSWGLAERDGKQASPAAGALPSDREATARTAGDKAPAGRTIPDLKIEVRAAELALEQAEKDLPLLERSTALEIQAAERVAKAAADELERFLKSGKARAETEARMKWEDAQASVKEEIDRLHELDNLYRKGASAEANEKLVLERSRRGVETSKFNLEGKRQAFDLALQVEIPAKEASL